MNRQFVTSEGSYALLLADPISGLPFGLGNTEEEAIADAVENSWYYPDDDEEMRQVPCTEAWVRARIEDGGLTFTTADKSERESDENDNILL
jgi:hypothetical protein